MENFIFSAVLPRLQMHDLKIDSLDFFLFFTSIKNLVSDNGLGF